MLKASKPLPAQLQIGLGSRFLGNVVWSGLGAGVPLVVAIWAIPVLIEVLGIERFGLMALLWAAIGYFGLFDLGFSRALTKLVAERLGTSRESEIPALVSETLRWLLYLSVIAVVAVVAGAHWIAGGVLALQETSPSEVLISFWLVAAVLPAVLLTTPLIGLLQAHQRFSQVAAVQMGLGTLTFVGPLFAVMLSPSLPAVALALGASRLLAWFVYRWMCRDLVPGARPHGRLAPRLRRELLRFGGWVTVSNAVGPLMVYMDRFLIGAILTLAAVTYYTTPYEIVTRLWVLSDALVAVVFPALATTLALDTAKARALFGGASRLLMVGIFAPVALVLLYATEALTTWLGPEFGRSSAEVLRWLAVGVFVNCAARLPFAALHARGRPDVTAKLHLIELPIYILTLWVLATRFGLQGAAAAWTLRIALDAALLFGCGAWFIPELKVVHLRSSVLASAGVAVLASLWLVEGTYLKAALAIGVGLCSLLWIAREVRLIWTQPDLVIAS